MDINELKVRAYDLIATKETAEAMLRQVNQEIAKRQQEERKSVKSVDQKGGVTAGKVNIKNSTIKDSNVVVDEKPKKK